MSDEYKKVIKLEFNYSQLGTSVSEIKRQMSLLNSEFANAKNNVYKYADETTKLELDVQHLSEKIHLQTQRVKLHKEALDNAEKSGRVTKEQLKTLQTAYLNSQATLGKYTSALEKAKLKLDKATDSISVYNEELKDLDKQISSVEKTEKLHLEELKRTGSEEEKLSVTIDSLAEKIELFSKKVELSNKAFEEATESSKYTKEELDRLEDAYKDNQIYLAKLNNEYEDAKDKLNDLKNPSDEFRDSMEDNISNAVELAGKLYIMKEALDKVKEGLQKYTEFDVGMAKVNTLADTTAVSMDKLKSGVYEISKETGQSVNVISDALYQCLSSSVQTTDALETTLVSAKLAKVGFTDCATSVDILTTIMNSYGEAAGSVKDISDKLILTQNLGKVTVGELGSSFGKVAGLAQQAGVSLDEVLSAVATLTQNGIPASSALDEIKAALSNIIKPSKEASDVAKELGIKFNATALQSAGLANFLLDVQSKCKGSTEKMAKLFGSVEALNGMLLLTGKASETFATTLDAMKNSTGTTDESLQKFESTGSKFNDAINAIQTSLVQLGDVLSPIIDFAAGLLNVLSNIPAAFYVVIGVLGAAILVITNLTKITKTYESVVLGVKSAYLLITGILGIKTTATMASAAADAAATTAATGAATANAALGASGMVATSGLMPLLVIILAITVAIAAITGTINSFRSSMKSATDTAKELTSSTSNVNSAIANTAQSVNMQKYTNSKGYYARGTDYSSEGFAMVGEDGPETVFLPRGSKVLSNRETKQAVSGQNIYIDKIEIPARDVREFTDVINIVKNQRMVRRKA